MAVRSLTMLGRKRLLNSAVGGIVVATLLLPLSARGQDNPKPEQKTGQSDAPRERIVIVPDAATLRSIFEDAVKVLRDEKAAGEAAEERKESREKSDLAAQQDMAFWAEWMVYIAGAQAVVAAITIGLLWFTFWETRRTAKAAVKATNASIGAERAWMFLVVHQNNFEGLIKAIAANASGAEREKLRVYFHFKNLGNTPAPITQFYATVAHLTELPAALIYDPPNEIAGGETAIGAGATFPTEIASAEHPPRRWWLSRVARLERDAAVSVRDGNSYLWFYGRLVYEDVWGDPHETRFCWRYDGMTAQFHRYGGKPYNENT